MHLVQTPIQYVFVHYALLEYLQSWHGGSANESDCWEAMEHLNDLIGVTLFNRLNSISNSWIYFIWCFHVDLCACVSLCWIVPLQFKHTCTHTTHAHTQCMLCMSTLYACKESWQIFCCKIFVNISVHITNHTMYIYLEEFCVARY